jgi:hypothetical protein
VTRRCAPEFPTAVFARQFVWLLGDRKQPSDRCCCFKCNRSVKGLLERRCLPNVAWIEDGSNGWWKGYRLEVSIEDCNYLRIVYFAERTSRIERNLTQPEEAKLVRPSLGCLLIGAVQDLLYNYMPDLPDKLVGFGELVSDFLR